MFQGYMSTGMSTGIPPNLANSGIPFITQESPIVTTPQKQISASPWTTNHPSNEANIQKSIGSELQTPDIDMSSNCSPHDNNIEQEDTSIK